MSVPPALIAVMSMLCVVTLMDLTLAHVNLDILEMAEVVLALVSIYFTENFKFLSGIKTCYLTSILAYLSMRYKLTFPDKSHC